MKEVYDIIREICKEKGITMHNLFKAGVIMFEKNGKIRFMYGENWDICHNALAGIMNDKYATYEVLKRLKIPVAEHSIFYRPHLEKGTTFEDSSTWQRMVDYFETHNQQIVLKGPSGHGGNNVFQVNSKEELYQKVVSWFANHQTLILMPFYHVITEYRLVYLNKECVFSYQKKNPVVIGDGKQTIRELLLQFNPIYFSNKLADEKYEKILKKGESFQYSFKCNCEGGGSIKDIDSEEMKARLLEIGDSIANKIDLGFSTIDIIETDTQEFMVIEMNCGYSIGKNGQTFLKDGVNVAKRLYRKILDDMYPEE